jgi:predicted transcriptional regulator
MVDDRSNLQTEIVRLVRTEPRLKKVVALGEASLTKNEREILLYLAEHGEGSKYDVSEEMDIDYRLVRLVFKRLSEWGWIQKVRRERTERNRNLWKDIYKPTTGGLLYAFMLKPENPHIFRRVKERFPRLLGKEDLWTRHRLAGAVVESFLYNVSLVLQGARRERAPIEGEVENLETEVLEDLFWNRGDLARMCSAAAEDRDLRKFLLPRVERARQDCRNREKMLKRALVLLREKTRRR